MQNGTIKKWVMGVLVATLLSMTWQGVFVRGQQVVRAATNMPTPTPAVSPTATPIKAPKGKLKRTQSTPITSGATHKIYQYTLQRGKDKPVAVVHVFEIDLTNPFVKVDLIMGYKNRLTTRASVLQMAKDSGAVAAMNADFFHMDERGLTSFGGSVQKGQLVTTPNNTRSLSGWYTFGLTKDKKPVIDFYTYASSLTTQSGLSQKIFAVNKEGSPYVAGDGSTTHTYKNRVMMFTSAWAREKRGQIDGLTPSEVLVQNGIVKQISLQKQISGRVPKKAVILSFDGTVAEKWLGGLAPKIKVGDTLAINTTFIPSNPMNPSHVEDFTMMVGGHSILINDGLQMKIPDEMYSGAQGSNYRSRTAIGYNKMMSKLYMVAVNRNDHSAGITLPEMTNIMLQLGCYKAMNLDGGGSTTVVTRPLGEMATSLASKVEFDSMRLVMNGIGVFSTAPKGILKDVTIFGPNTMLIGEQASYRLTGYDTYYNPVTVAAMKPVWSFDANFGQAKKATFQALKSGDTQVTVTAGPIKKSVPLHVIAGSDLVKLEMVTPVKLAKAGQAGEMVVYATTKSGDRKVVPDKALKWSFVGMNASVKAGTFAIKGVYKAAAAGKIVVNYDGFSSSLELPFEQSDMGSIGVAWEQFDTKLKYKVKPEYLPATVKGSVGVVNGALQFNYDFRKVNHTKVLYAKFNGKAGVAIPGNPTKMQIRVLGDRSNNTMRMEVLDGAGVTRKVELTAKIDWAGWRTLSVDLTKDVNGAALKGPLTLKRLYVFDWGDHAFKRAQVGTVAVDDWFWLAFDVTQSSTFAGKQGLVHYAIIDGKWVTAAARDLYFGSVIRAIRAVPPQ